MTFLHPIALWGLLALIVPFVIHLLSKKEKNQIYFGSNKFLTDQETTSARSFQISDLGLLALRMLLLAALIFAIAGLSQLDNTTRKIAYIEKTLEEDDDYSSILSTLDPTIFKSYFSYDRSVATDDIAFFPSAFTLLDKLNLSKDSITVYTHSLQQNFIGEQIIPNQNITWKILPKKENQQERSLNKEPLSIEIVSATKSYKHKTDFKNVLSSLGEVLPFDIKYRPDADWIIFIDTLGQGNAANSINWNTDHPNFNLEKQFDNYQLSGSMSKQGFLDTNFPLELSQMLIESQTSSRENENKVFDPTTLTSNKIEVLQAGTHERYNSRSGYLWLLVIALILLERYFALRHSIK